MEEKNQISSINKFFAIEILWRIFRIIKSFRNDSSKKKNRNKNTFDVKHRIIIKRQHDNFSLRDKMNLGRSFPTQLFGFELWFIRISFSLSCSCVFECMCLCIPFILKIRWIMLSSVHNVNRDSNLCVHRFAFHPLLMGFSLDVLIATLNVVFSHNISVFFSARSEYC